MELKNFKIFLVIYFIIKLAINQKYLPNLMILILKK